MGEFVDGVERPGCDHFVRDNRILTWSAVCPECSEVMPTGFDRNAAPEQNYGQEVPCTICRERFTFDAESCRIRDLTDDLRHAQQNRRPASKDQRIAALEADLARMTAERDTLLGKASAYDDITNALRPRLTHDQNWITTVLTLVKRAEQAEAQYRQEAGEHMHTADSLSLCRANLEAAEAQVAVLADALTKVRNTEWNLAGPANIDHAGRWYINREVRESLMAAVEAALANLPAAAARLLAAERVAEAVDDIAEYLGPEVDAALEEWRARWKETHHADP